MATNHIITVAVHDLTYTYQGTGDAVLSNISLNLPRGSRTILVGANGGLDALSGLLGSFFSVLP